MKKPEKATLDQDWVSAKKACAYLECSFPTLKRYINENKLRATQITPKGKIRVSASSIEMLLNRGGTA